jgi:hypothetical protein
MMGLKVLVVSPEFDACLVQVWRWQAFAVAVQGFI